MEKVIKLEKVSKYFKEEKVLDDVSMEFEKGKIYGIVGKNGSGKTVLFKVIAGYLKTSSGSVYVNNKK